MQRGRWFGTGVLKLARPGEPWSVWLFWEPGWQFKNWYVNLEEPLARWAGGVDSEDHFLDISVYPDRTWGWRDEDEFAQAQQDGLMDARAGRAGPGGGPVGGGGDPRLGAAVLGRLGELAPGSVLGRTVAAGGLGPHARAHVRMRPLMRPRAANVGSSSARARSRNSRSGRRA